MVSTTDWAPSLGAQFKCKFVMYDTNAHNKALTNQSAPLNMYDARCQYTRHRNVWIQQGVTNNSPVRSGQQWAGHPLSAHWSCCEHQSLRSQSQSRPAPLESVMGQEGAWGRVVGGGEGHGQEKRAKGKWWKDQRKQQGRRKHRRKIKRNKKTQWVTNFEHAQRKIK